MSWYYNNINGFKAEHQGHAPYEGLRAGLFPPAAVRNIVYSMKITDMKSKEDAEKLSSALLKIEGVSEVNPLLHQNKLAITFNPLGTSLANITRTIANLGYHYIQRRCKCCG